MRLIDLARRLFALLDGVDVDKLLATIDRVQQAVERILDAIGAQSMDDVMLCSRVQDELANEPSAQAITDPAQLMTIIKMVVEFVKFLRSLRS